MKEKLFAFSAGILLAIGILELGLQVFGGFQESGEGEVPRISAGNIAVCVGDSFTHGMGATSDQSYPRQLEGLLNEGTAEKWNVINLGSSAINSSEIFEILRENIDAVKPKVVVILAGGANAWNYKGYTNYLQGNTLGAKLLDYAYSLHTFRLIRLLTLNVREKSLVTSRVKEKRMRGNEYDAQGMKYKNDNRYEKAIDSFKKVILKNPSAAINYVNLVQIYSEMGRNEEAEKYYALATKLPLVGSMEYAGLGNYHLTHARVEKALSFYKKGIEADLFSDNNRNFSGLRAVYSKNDPALCDDIASFVQVVRDKYGVRNPFIDEVLEKKKRGLGRLDAWIKYDLERMIRLCREKGAIVILQNYPAAKRPNPLYEKIAKDNSILFVDQAAFFREPVREQLGTYFTPDGHCNARGYGVMAQNVFKTMEEAGLIRTGDRTINR